MAEMASNAAMRRPASSVFVTLLRSFQIRRSLNRPLYWFSILWSGEHVLPVNSRRVSTVLADLCHLPADWLRAAFVF